MRIVIYIFSIVSIWNLRKATLRLRYNKFSLCQGKEKLLFAVHFKAPDELMCDKVPLEEAKSINNNYFRAQVFEESRVRRKKIVLKL